MKISPANQKRIDLSIILVSVAAIPVLIYFDEWFWAIFWSAITMSGILQHIHKWYYIQRLLPLAAFTANILINTWDGDVVSELTAVTILWTIWIIVVVKDSKRKEYSTAKT